MATDYVDAGQAIDNTALSPIVGSAPPVTDGVTYERILNARSEPQNWLTGGASPTILLRLVFSTACPAST